MEANTNFELWVRYNARLLELAKKGDCHLVCLEQLISDPGDVVKRLVVWTGLDGANTSKAESLVDQAMVKHHGSNKAPTNAQQLYDALFELARS